MGKRKKILFIGHNATVSGAPKSLLWIMEQLSKDSSYVFDLLLQDGGPLLNQYSKYGNVYEFLPKKFYSYKHFFGVLYQKIALRFYRFYLKKKIKKNNYDLIYINSIAAKNATKFTSDLNIKTIFHCRELAATIKKFGGASAINFYHKLSNKIITVSQSTTELLQNNFKIPKNKLLTIPNAIPLHSFKIVNQNFNLRASLNIPSNAFICITIGSFDFGKGADLFAKTIAKVIPKKQIHFVWIGNISTSEFNKFNSTFPKSNLHFIPPKTDIYTYLKDADLHLSFSREESFGLIPLEAAYYNIPTLCFKGSGGLSENVKNGFGFIIERDNINKMAHKIEYLHDNKHIIKELGAKAHEHLINNFSYQSFMKKIKHCMDSLTS